MVGLGIEERWPFAGSGRVPRPHLRPKASSARARIVLALAPQVSKLLSTAFYRLLNPNAFAVELFSGLNTKAHNSLG